MPIATEIWNNWRTATAMREANGLLSGGHVIAYWELQQQGLFMLQAARLALKNSKRKSKWVKGGKVARELDTKRAIA